MAAIPAMDTPTAMPIVAAVDSPSCFGLSSAPPVLVGVAVGSVEEVGGVEVGVEEAEVVVRSPFAALKKSLWLTLMGVSESEQAPDMVVYTSCTSFLAFSPRHLAVLMMKLPPLPQKHVLRAGAVSPLHLDVFAAWYMHGWEAWG
jgi:hypothetical protein